MALVVASRLVGTAALTGAGAAGVIERTRL
jgi:hypothetical protein